MTDSTSIAETLVLGATGKTGRHIARQLEERGVPVRIGSRQAPRPFSWDDRSGWARAMEGVRAIYIAYAPDLAVPGAPADIAALVKQARQSGVEQLVLLSGRGEPEAETCEDIVRYSGLRWTIIRASWFFQNFSEGAFQPMIEAGEIALPVGHITEPFIDVRDIADIAVAALTSTEHDGQLYEVTGPQSLTFGEVAALIAAHADREVSYVEVSLDAFIAGAREAGLPTDIVWLMGYLFGTILDGRNSLPTGGVARALGREPRGFSDFADSVVEGVWTVADSEDMEAAQ